MIITLCGSNNFAIRQTLDGLVKAYVEKYGKHGLERVDGETFDLAKLSDIFQGASLFAANRLIIIRDASKNKPLWDEIGEKVDQIPDETTIVLVEGELDKRTRTYKQLKAKSDFRELTNLGESQLLDWLSVEAEIFGGSIERDAAQYLLQQVGDDQWRLRHEMEKLVIFDPVVTKESINELVEASPQASAFDLLDAALGKKPAKMRELLAKLRVNEDPYKFFGLLISQVYTLALVAHAEGRGTDEIAKLAAVHPFVVRKTSSLARSIKKPELQEIIDEVAETDYKLKSSGHDPWILLEQLLNKIATR